MDQWTIPKKLEGLRPDRALRGLRQDVDRDEALRALKEKRLWVNGEVATLQSTVKAGDKLKASGVKPRAQRPAPPALEPARRKARPLPDAPLFREHRVGLLWLDEHLCVVDKPAGMPTHPADGVGELATLTDVVARQLAAWGRTVERPPAAAGRLDRGTSGVVVLTLSRAAEKGMAVAFEADAVDKTYVALARGVTSDVFDVDAPLTVAKYVRGSPKVEKVKDAVTHFERLAHGPKASLLLVRPQTGRLHQIRRHLRHAGHPIVGDGRYGWREDRGSVVFCLHCQRVEVKHPVTGTVMVWTTPLPPAFVDALAGFGIAAPRGLAPPGT